MAEKDEKKNGESEDKTLAGIKALGDNMKQIGSALEGLNNRITAVESRNVAPPDANTDQVTKREPKSDEDLDEMSRSQFMSHIVEEISHVLVKPLAQMVDNNAEGLTVKDTKKSVEDARDAHPDFMEFEREILQIAKDVKGISPERAYQMARNENPEKASEMDVKYMSEEDKEKKKVEEEKKVAEEKGDSTTEVFGGLTPTSGVPAEKADYKDNKEAFDAAWDENVTQAGLEGMFRAQ